MRSNKFKNADATAAQNIALQLWQQSARRANAGRKAFSISEMMLSDMEFIAAEAMADKANAMLAAPAKLKQTAAAVAFWIWQILPFAFFIAVIFGGLILINY